MTDLSQTHLVLFFTKGVSLKTWADTGLLERELALYQRLAPHLAGVTLVTYGDGRDRAYADHLGELALICNDRDLPDSDYVHTLIASPPVPPGQPAIFKSNQVWGADVALQAARRHGAKAITRCGYLFSDFMAREHGSDSLQARQANALEQKLFRLADGAVVTTPTMKGALAATLGVDRARVIPNYVLTDAFRPMPDIAPEPDLALSIGRFVDQKNPFNLVNAFRDSPYRLHMIGGGGHKVRLRRHIKKEQLPVTMLGNQPHLALPELLNRAAVYVQPSLFEGHPKTLLEAMACGRPVVATDVSGISAEIADGENGYLCQPDSASIRAALDKVFGNPDLAARMGAAAREQVLRRYALERVVSLELELYDDLLRTDADPA